MSTLKSEDSTGQPISPVAADENAEEQGLKTEGSMAKDDDSSNDDATRPMISDSTLRKEYFRLEVAYRRRMEQDELDAKKGLQRERYFTVAYNRMSRNKLWAAKEGSECAYYDASPEEYTHHQDIWPRGRDLRTLNLYSQLFDFFRFMWSHTKPYKTVAVVLIMSVMKPFQVATISFVVQYIENNPKTAPLWLYFFNFYGYTFDRFLYWYYQMWVPLNSQRVQMRCVLLQKRARLPYDHPIAKKWQAGRFTGLLKDVDEVINGVWQSMLDMIDDMVTMIYLVILCFVNLAVSLEKNPDGNAYATYIGIFLGLGILTMALPFLWFHLFDSSVQDCERMIREGQALYMSASQERLAAGESLYRKESGGRVAGVENVEGSEVERRKQADSIAVSSYWLYGRTTFRGFFHRLAWETNYGFLTHVLGPFVAYFLLTREGFGASFGSANIIIVLLSLQNLGELSEKLLKYLVKMSRGCNVLRDVADILNTNLEDYEPIDLEKGCCQEEETSE